MTRGIKAGLSSMAEALVDRFNERKQDPEAPALTLEQSRKIIRSLSPDSPPLQETDAGVNLREEDIFEMIQPALERLSRQVERTFEHYATMMPGERIVRIYVSGAMNVYQPIVEYVGSQLGISSAVLDPLSEQESAACPDVEDTGCISERIAFGPALGLALSDNDHTPNLMFTYKDKDGKTSIKRINQAVFAGLHGRRAHLLRRLHLPEPCHQPEEGGNRRTRNTVRRSRSARRPEPAFKTGGQSQTEERALQGLCRPVSGYGPDQRTRSPDAEGHPFYRSENHPRTGAGGRCCKKRTLRRREWRRSPWRG